MTTMTRTYSEMMTLPTFKDRFEYLSLRGNVGDPTFGSERYLNQRFYASREWKILRNEIIVRDQGLDLGAEGYEIPDRVMIHHMNPIRVSDIVHGNEDIVDPEFLISVSAMTHNAIHYGDPRQLPRNFVDRKPGDTRLW